MNRTSCHIIATFYTQIPFTFYKMIMFISLVATCHAVFDCLLFYIGLRWSDLTPKDQRTCKYVHTYIHQLPFEVPSMLSLLYGKKHRKNFLFEHTIAYDRPQHLLLHIKGDTSKETC